MSSQPIWPFPFADVGAAQRARTRSAGTAEKQREIPERDRGECRELLVFDLEPEVFRVEGDGAGDIGDLVANSVKAGREIVVGALR